MSYLQVDISTTHVHIGLTFVNILICTICYNLIWKITLVEPRVVQSSDKNVKIKNIHEGATLRAESLSKICAVCFNHIPGSHYAHLSKGANTM